MRGILEAIRARGAELVVVGNGRPEHAADFRATHDLRFPLYVDPELRAYAAAGLERGVLRTLGPRALAAGWRAFRAGYRQGMTQGDPWQEGGVFVIRPDGTVPFAQVSESAGDHAHPQDILAAL